MVDFYPFTVQDLPKLSPLLKKDYQRVLQGNVGNTILFLVPLAVDLFEDVKKIREFKKGLKNKNVKEGFLEIVQLWLEENKGTGNLLNLVNVLRLNGHFEFAYALEVIIINCYSLSSEDDNFCYFQSRNFLTEAEQPPACVVSREKVFQNCVIMEEIFKKLDPAGQKTFRLVSSAWKEETYKFWRRHARINLHTQLPQEDDMVEPRGISVVSFSIIVQSTVGNSEIGEDAEAMQKIEKELDSQLLQKIISDPFKSYKMLFAGGIPFSGLHSWAIIKPFWQILGPHIEDLQIDKACFNDQADEIDVELNMETILTIFCEQVFLKAKNLKKLEILPSCAGHQKKYFHCFNDDTREEQEQHQVTNLNLHTLKFGIGLPANTLRHILCMCPNLKELSLTTGEGLDGLPHRTATGEFIYLEKLSVNLSIQANIIPLRNYVKILDQVSLRHLQLKGVNLAEARLPPFHLYGVIGHCSHNLRSLELQVCILGEQLSRKWYTDLAPFSFPVLSQLKLSFNSGGHAEHIKFDFGSLKGMPKLRLLEIKSKQKGSEEVARNPGVQDWIFEGDRNTYFPEGLTADYFYSEEDPILCSKLTEFTFLAWSLNTEDIRLLQSWFPKLNCLEAEIKSQTLPVLMEKWDLDKLRIHTGELLSLRELRPLKKNKIIRIFQIVRGTHLSCTVELKEQNNRLYFLSSGSTITSSSV